ncbi:MAG TPA: class I poly(R)-hydroxyalkanoic acid synthase [Rhodospirillaceae bacterium]|nr:class I poly(R)-hydroxyalkanoic acid synthase [Alphaproteobacteria bacterium]HBH26715.1 class I poly(R)-hydroxyalkanoic acid synthase [Rhodospirillaceae bacterium]
MQGVFERAVPLANKFLEKYGSIGDQPLDPFNIRGALTDYALSLLRDPARAMALQMDFWRDWTDLWQASVLRALGENTHPVITPKKGDRRFRAPEWQENAVFDFIKQSYLLTAQWMQKGIAEAKDLTPADRHKLHFHADLFASALSPSNFALTNPEVLKEAARTGGESLVRGMENLIQDLERGDGELKISLTDYKAFKPGDNLAITPGRVVFENAMMQLVQYAPETKEVHATPILFVPPWINKFYILDMREDNSLVKWLVSQGYTVFMISWANPDASMADIGFEDYMQTGILTALDEVLKITGQETAHTVGYCIGGTLLGITLAYLAAKGGADKVSSATFFTTLLDFAEAGDLKLFTEEPQIAALEAEMAEKGFLDARNLQKTFSLLRSNDLIWSFVVNNYLMGKDPFPFDLLYWNDDSTNMPAKMHSFYLRGMYLENNLATPGKLKVAGVPIDLGKVKTPAYFISTREDHIAPWVGTYAGTQLLGGPVTFTLAGSGHIAGIVNPPARGKYAYWINSKNPPTPEAWDEGASENAGSWWPHWDAWLSQRSGGMIPARKPAKGIEAAPGRYVLG